MKRRELMRSLAQIAKRQGVTLSIREGGRHTVVQIGQVQVSVPRHAEINEITAQSILKRAEQR